MKQLYSTGETAAMLGVHRDTIQSALVRGAPRPGMRVGKRYAYSDADILKLFDWLTSKGVAATRPDFSLSHSTA